MSYIPYSKNPSGIAFFGTSSTDPVFKSVSGLFFDSGLNSLTLDGVRLDIKNAYHAGSLVSDGSSVFISKNGVGICSIEPGSANSGDYYQLLFDIDSEQIGSEATLGGIEAFSGPNAKFNLFGNKPWLLNGIPISVSGHKHLSSDITNFASSVSGLLPVKNILSGSGINVSNNAGEFTVAVTGSFGLTGEQVDDRVNDLLVAGNNIVLNYDDNNNNLTISTSGLQSSGNYSTVGHTHNIIDVSGLQVALDSKQPSGNYANLIHTHTSSDITNFNTSVSGLIDGIYAPLNSPSFSGIPTVPTATSGTSTNQIASTSFVRTEIANLVDSAPSTLDTLNELAAALGDDANFSTTVTNSLANKANLSGATFTGLISGPSGNFTSLTQNNVPVSVSGHTHISSDITDFNSGVSGVIDDTISTLLQAGSYISLVYNSGTDTLTISATGLQASGSYASLSHSHSIVDVSGLQLALDGKQPSGSYAALSHSHSIVDVSGLQLALDGKQPSGSYASGIHYHISSDITDFNSSVSGLLPVKNISAGYDISISNVSGNYTIASTNLVHVDSKQPQGFINRTDSRISVSGNIFTIAPTGSSYSFYNQGIKVIKTSGDSLTIPNITQINYIHFDTINNQLSNKTTGFDFSTDIPIAYVAWNSGVGPSGQMTFFAEERHGIVMDTSTHKWIHNTFGVQYVDGLSIGNYVLGGNGTSNSHATISIGNGTLYQEDIEINITDSSSTDPFCQELSPIAQIPIYYHQGSTGQWVKNTATDYPVKYGANGPQYNLLSGGVWTTPDVSPGGQTRYFAVWILATNQIDDPIISIMGQRIDSNQGSAENNNLWSDVNLTNLPLSEVKPLYRLIFAGDRDYTNVPKCSLLSILDIRVAVISTIAGVSQNDHGSLFGLGDDDHSQYVHIDNARTIDANHTFTNGLTSNGLISSSSGNFGSLSVNNVSVSISGHTHVSSDISNFNSSVSGLLPVKNILAGSGIAVSGNLGAYTVSVDIIDCGVIAPTSIFIPPTVAYYAFNANVTDANALYNGTAYGSPSFVSGYVGNAIELNSPSKYVTVPRSISTNWTISFFVKTASASPSSSNWYDGVNLLNGEMPGNVNDFGVVYLNNKVAIGIGNPDTTIFSSSTINNNAWRHVCTTRNSTTGQVKIYIDGTLETTTNMPTGAKSAASTLIIGGSVKYGSFSGLIDNMKIFDSVLTDAQISSLATGN